MVIPSPACARGVRPCKGLVAMVGPGRVAVAWGTGGTEAPCVTESTQGDGFVWQQCRALVVAGDGEPGL